MKKNQIISIIIGVLILIGIASGFSYWLGQKSVEVKTEVITSSLLGSKIIQNWSATASGVVKKKSENTLIIEAKEETLDILVEPKTVIKEALLENEEKEVKEISFEDINTGDGVNITIGVDENGKIWATSIIILPK